MKQPRLLGVGHVSLDHMFEVEALPTRPVKTPALAYACRVGGMTANASVAAARLGAAVRFAGPVGDDDAAPRFANHFHKEGIDTQGLTRVPRTASSVSTVIVDALGERLIFNHRGSALFAAPPLRDEWLDDVDVLITDPRCPAWAEAALRGARARRLVSVLDGDAAPQGDLQRLVPLATWAVFSEQGLAAFAPGLPAQQALAAALAVGAEVAVVTLGARGLLWQRAGGPVQAMPAFAVAPVLDTTAAGDVFHGALAVVLAEGRGDADALRFAAVAAALKCSRRDGVLGAPGRGEVDQWVGSSPTLEAT